MGTVQADPGPEQLGRMLRAIRLEADNLRFIADVKGLAVPAIDPADVRVLLARVLDGAKALEEYARALEARLATHPHLASVATARLPREAPAPCGRNGCPHPKSSDLCIRYHNTVSDRR